MNSQWHTFPSAHFHSHVGLSQVNRVTVKADDKSSNWLQKFPNVKTFTIILSSMNPNQTLVSKQEAQQAQILSFSQLVYADTQKCFYFLSNRNSLWNVNKTRHILRMHFLFPFLCMKPPLYGWKSGGYSKSAASKRRKSFLFTQATKMLIRSLNTLIKLASMLKSRGSMPVLITDIPRFTTQLTPMGNCLVQHREGRRCLLNVHLSLSKSKVSFLMHTLWMCKFQIR